MSKHSEGPYSVHPYTDCQGPHTLATGIVVQGITIGAGRKMLGEVRMASKRDGFPAIDNEAEMRATAALWIAAPELLEACRAMIEWDDAEKSAKPFDEDQGKGFYYRMELCAEAFNKARAAIAKAESTPC